MTLHAFFCKRTLALGLLASLVASCPGQAQTPPRQDLNSSQTADKLVAIQGAIGGVGAVLGKTNANLVVLQVLPNGPAERAGVQPGSLIRSINGTPAATLQLADAVKLMRGPVGSELRLELQSPDGEARQLTLVREKVAIAPVTARRIEEDLLLLKPTGFDKETAAALKAALTKPADAAVRAIILDLRGSPGGWLPALEQVAGEFLPTGSSLWFLRESNGKLVECRSQAPRVSQKPLVVWVDAHTLMPELIASAIQRNHRGDVVGQPTSGYATNGIREVVQHADGTSHYVSRGALLLDQAGTHIRVTPDRLVPETATEDDYLKATREALAGRGL